MVSGNVGFVARRGNYTVNHYRLKVVCGGGRKVDDVTIVIV